MLQSIYRVGLGLFLERSPRLQELQILHGVCVYVHAQLWDWRGAAEQKNTYVNRHNFHFNSFIFPWAWEAVHYPESLDLRSGEKRHLMAAANHNVVYFIAQSANFRNGADLARG